MDMPRLLVRTKCATILNDLIKVKISGAMFRSKLVEDTYGLLRLHFLAALESVGDSSDSDMERQEGDEEEYDVDGNVFENFPLVEAINALGNKRDDEVGLSRTRIMFHYVGTESK